jgi:hypothetical protein
MLHRIGDDLLGRGGFKVDKGDSQGGELSEAI